MSEKYAGSGLESIVERVQRLQQRIAEDPALTLPSVGAELAGLYADLRGHAGSECGGRIDIPEDWQDLVKKHRVEQALHDSELRYRSLHDNLPLGVFRSTPGGKFLSVNPAMAAMFGFASPDEMLHISIPELYCDPQRRKELVRLLAAKMSYTDTEIQMRRKDGSAIWVSSSVHAATDAQGEIIHFDGIVQDITQRKSAVEAMRQNEEFNRAVVANSPIGISVRNKFGRLLSYNFSWKRIWRIWDEDLDDYLHGERTALKFDERDRYLGQWQPVVRRIYEEGGQLHVPEIHLADSRKGGNRWLSQFFYALKDENGYVDRVVILTEDITERKKAELALRESEEKYRALVEQSIQGILIAQGDPMHIVFANPACVEILGHSIEELLSFSSKDIATKIYPDDQSRVFEIHRDRMQGRPVPSRYEFRIIRCDGSVRLVEITSTTIVYNSQPAVQAIFVDVTERRRVEEALRESEKRYRRLVESSDDLIFSVDRQGVFHTAGGARLRDFGLRPEDLVGRSLGDLFPPEDVGPYMKRHQEVFDSGMARTFESVFEFRGVQRTDQTTVYPIENERGEIDLVGVICRDVTEQKRAETELYQAHQELEQRVAERTARLSSAIADLKREIESRQRIEKKLLDYQRELQSLTSELTLTEERERRRIATELHDGIGQPLALAKIRLSALFEELSARHLDGTLAEIRDQIETTISRTRSLTFELSPPILYDLGLKPALEWLAEEMGKRHGLNIEFVDDGMTIDPAEDIRVTLFQATRELLTNVVKHAQARRVQVSVALVENRVYITVADDGVGFDGTAADIGREGGGRFGLFSIRERLHLLGGVLKIDAVPGRGSSITLATPLLVENNTTRER